MAAATGQVNVATPGTAVQGPNVVAHTILLRALPANTGPVFIGRSQATANATSGFALAQTDPPIKLTISNLSDLWFDASVAASKVSWLAID